jgi:hypothetical protein
MANKAGKYEYEKDLDFIKAFGEANGNVEEMNKLFGRADTPLSKASIAARRVKIKKEYGINLRMSRTSKFIKADRDEARNLAVTMGFTLKP